MKASPPADLRQDVCEIKGGSGGGGSAVSAQQLPCSGAQQEDDQVHTLMQPACILVMAVTQSVRMTSCPSAPPQIQLYILWAQHHASGYALDAGDHRASCASCFLLP